MRPISAPSSHAHRCFAPLAVAAIVALAGSCLTPPEDVDAAGFGPSNQMTDSGRDLAQQSDAGGRDTGGRDTGPPDSGDTPDQGTPTDTAVDQGEPDLYVPCDGMCGADELCLETEQRCVECFDAADCGDGVCSSDNRCVECVSTTDCGAGVCDLDTNLCVQCLTSDDCTSPSASLCDTDTNTCGACGINADCGHLADVNVCDDGECVECTGTDFDACAGVCDSRLRTCTAIPELMTGLCQACVSDAQCRPGMLCTAMTFEADDGSGPAEVGTFCLWRRNATEPTGPNGSCFNTFPYVDATDSTSLDDVTEQVCGLAFTTCPALNDHRDAQCPTAGVHDSCGAPGFDDGRCVSAGGAVNRCTIPCAGGPDCPEGFACDVNATPRVCEI